MNTRTSNEIYDQKAEDPELVSCTSLPTTMSEDALSSSYIPPMQKKLFPLLTLQAFDSDRHLIQEIHDELRRDGYFYVECDSELLSCLEEVQKISQIFFNLPVNQKKSFLSRDVMEKRRAKMTKKKTQPPPASIPVRINPYAITDDDCAGFEEPTEVGCLFNSSRRYKSENSGDSSSFWSAFFNLFAYNRPAPSHPVPTTKRLPQPQSNNNNNDQNKPRTNKCEDLKANFQLLNVNRALSKGYSNNEKQNPREFYDISRDDEFSHPEFHQIISKTYLLFEKYSMIYFQLLMKIIDVQNDDYLYALINGESHSRLRLIRYNFIGDEDKETCQRHTDMGLLTLAPALSSGLEMKSFQHPYNYIDVEAASPSKPCLILFAGEALGRLTGGYYQAPIHRVTSNFRRFSFPFFFRSTAKLVLDIKQLKSNKLEELIEKKEIESLLSITANDLEILTQVQYKTKQIPIELGNYKRNLYYQQLFD